MNTGASGTSQTPGEIPCISKSHLNNEIAPPLTAGLHRRQAATRGSLFLSLSLSTRHGGKGKIWAREARLRRTSSHTRRQRSHGREETREQREGGRGGIRRRRRAATATKYCVRAENTALGTRVSGAAGFRMSRSARRLYANSTQIPSRRYLYRSHTSAEAPR